MVAASPEPASVERPAWSARPRWQRLAVGALAVLLAAGLVTTPWWGPRTLARFDFFHVRTVEFDGIRFAKPAELVTRLRVDTTQSVWQPLDSLEARLASHPMVQRVIVERDLPGTIRVHVTEREPVALVPSARGLQPVDAVGKRLPIDPATTALDVPLAASADSALLTVLDGLRRNAPDVYRRVSHAERAAPEELRFTLTGSKVGAAGPARWGAIIVRSMPDVTVTRFRDILRVEENLAQNHLRAVELDLRFRDQVIARQP